jgi:hypothetical protein
MMSEIDLYTFPETVWQDTRFAARMPMKHAGFSTTAILVLGHRRQHLHSLSGVSDARHRRRSE